MCVCVPECHLCMFLSVFLSLFLSLFVSVCYNVCSKLFLTACLSVRKYCYYAFKAQRCEQQEICRLGNNFGMRRQSHNLGQ